MLFFSVMVVAGFNAHKKAIEITAEDFTLLTQDRRIDQSF